MALTPRFTDPLARALAGLAVLPAPSNLSAWWNFGSLLGCCLGLQIVTGLLVATHYLNSLDEAFSSVVAICRDVNFGWALRTIHANGASLFFICLYAHTGRGIYYGSYRFTHTWSVGVTILFLTMATAFLGYVLPWGQMSFWGATVITNLLSTVPYMGTMLVTWLWGGYAVDAPTLTRFFSFHFVLPFVIAALVVVHIMYLHTTGSNNPLGISSNTDKIPFHAAYSYKDLLGFLLFFAPALLLVMEGPYLLGDPENFTPANPLSTPPHIQPEWYYLFAYAILRSIPNKLGGVVALVASIALLYALPFLALGSTQTLAFNPPGRALFWCFVCSAILLTWIGARPVEDPYIMVGQTLTVVYFLFFSLFPVICQSWDKWAR